MRIPDENDQPQSTAIGIELEDAFTELIQQLKSLKGSNLVVGPFSAEKNAVAGTNSHYVPFVFNTLDDMGHDVF